jgi:hypothetical protein
VRGVVFTPFVPLRGDTSPKWGKPSFGSFLSNWICGLHTIIGANSLPIWRPTGCCATHRVLREGWRGWVLNFVRGVLSTPAVLRTSSRSTPLGAPTVRAASVAAAVRDGKYDDGNSGCAFDGYIVGFWGDNALGVSCVMIICPNPLFLPFSFSPLLTPFRV